MIELEWIVEWNVGGSVFKLLRKEGLAASTLLMNDGQVLKLPDVAWQALGVVIQQTFPKTSKTSGGIARRTGEGWSAQEDAELLSQFSQRRRISDIAKKHERTRSAIESRLVKIGAITRKKPILV